MKSMLFLILGAVWWAALPAWADKTDLAKETYVEASETDFALTVKATEPAGRKVRKFELSAPQPGAFTLLCFVDGKFFRREAIRLPGFYLLSTRGLAVGTHRVTLQVVDSSGRIGSAQQTVETGK